jgi:hypothetical protein
VNGDTSQSNITITGSEIQGDITFDNGCAVAGDTVYECDGSKRQMNGGEKKKMAKRRAQLMRKQNQMRRRDVVETEVTENEEINADIVNRKQISKKKKKNIKNRGKKKFKDSGMYFNEILFGGLQR